MLSSTTTGSNALLRALCRNDTHLCVCWMLTPDVAGPDGKKTKYLKQPSKWRDFDCELFQLLKQAVPGNGRVAWAEEVRLLRSACFFSRLLNDSKAQRERYFEKFLRCAKSSEIVFFGPENGLQVPSRPYGRKDSSKYLYWEELEATWDADHSVLLYQHFRRQKREELHSQSCSRPTSEDLGRTGCCVPDSSRRVLPARTS